MTLGTQTSIVLVLLPSCYTPGELNRYFSQIFFFFRSFNGVRLDCSINVFYFGVYKIFRTIERSVFLFQGHLELFLEIG